MQEESERWTQFESLIVKHNQSEDVASKKKKYDDILGFNDFFI